MTCRDHARPIIAAVLKQQAGKDPKTVRKALREAYPFGGREMWPYRVWCSEVNFQLGIGKRPRPVGAHKPLTPAAGQKELF